MPSSAFKQELIIRSIKIIDIGFITAIYFLIAFGLSTYIDKKLGKFDPVVANRKSMLMVFCEIFLHIYMIGVFAYVIRNLVELIPYPLHGIEGYDHRKLKELGGGVIFTFVFFFYQENLKEKLLYFYERLTHQDHSALRKFDHKLAVNQEVSH